MEVFMKKVALALSGGLDSSMSIHYLREKKYHVTAFYMKNGAFGEEAERDAKRVADYFDVELHVIDTQEQFQKKVISYFKNEYSYGKTPNPCAVCNHFIKFGLFIEGMNGFDDFDYYSTGHYAQIIIENGRYFLVQGGNIKKDQSYFLSTIDRNLIPKLIFPLGFKMKENVRKEAIKIGLPVAEKGDSQEICFIPADDYKRYLNENGLILPEGDIILDNGEVMGQHKGIHTVTIGQRKGLGFSAKEKLFVKKIDVVNNKVIVAPYGDLVSKTLIASNINYMVDDEYIRYLVENKEMVSTKCRIRNGSLLADAEFFVDNGILTVNFKFPQFAITPGQLCVVYENNKVILSAFII